MMAQPGKQLGNVQLDAGEQPDILIAHPEADAYRRHIVAHLPGAHVEIWPDRGVPEQPLSAQALLTWRPPAGLLEKLPSLTWLHAAGAGVDHLLDRPDLDEEVILTRSRGRFGIQAAEYVAGYLLYLLLEVEDYRRDQDRAVWRPRRRRLLADLTVGIMGLGNVGGCIAARLSALGTTVFGACRSSRPVRGVERVFAGPAWTDMLEHSDVLVLALPLTSDTRELIDAAALERLPKGAILVNVSRGELIVESDLVNALRAGDVGAAVLDTFAEEPLPPDSPLWNEPRAWITPHVAAPSEVEPIAAEFIHNYRRFVDGLELEETVDRERGY